MLEDSEEADGTFGVAYAAAGREDIDTLELEEDDATVAGLSVPLVVRVIGEDAAAVELSVQLLVEVEVLELSVQVSVEVATV